MKKKIVFILLGISLTFCNVAPTLASDKSSTNSEARIPITSGALYEDIVSVCPDVTIYDSENTLHIYINTIDLTNGGSTAAFDFIETVSGILSCKSFKQYENAVIGHFDTDGVVTISVMQYENASNFITTLSTNLDDEAFNNSVESFYYDILGHFDSEYYFRVLEYAIKESSGEKAEEPEIVYADEYLLYGSIPNNLHWHEVENNTMYIHLDKLDASKDGGILFGQYVSKFITTFVLSPRPYSFNEFEFICVGNNGQLLGTLAFYVDDNNSLSVVNKNFYCPDFFRGFNEALDI